MIEQWKHVGTPNKDLKSLLKKKGHLSGWNHGEGNSQQCNTYFFIQFNNLLTLPRQDNTPATKAHSRFLRRPLTQSLLGNWKSSSLSLSDSELLNQPKFASSFSSFFFYSAFTQLEVTIVMLSLQALQFNEDRAAVLIGCLKWLLFFFSWNVFLLRFFFLVWRTVKMLRTITPFNIIVDSHLSLRQKDCPVWWSIFKCAVLLFNVH